MEISELKAFAETFGKTIAKVRTKKGVTQALLAEKLKVPRSNVSSIEHGKAVYTPYPRVRLLCRLFKIEIDDTGKLVGEVVA